MVSPGVTIHAAVTRGGDPRGHEGNVMTNIESSDQYFTERDERAQPRVERELSDSAWSAIAALTTGRIRDGSLGEAFPNVCQDHTSQTVGVDERLFADALVGDIPSLDWPLPDESPGTGAAMDVIEFIDRHVASAERRSCDRVVRAPHDTLTQQLVDDPREEREEILRLGRAQVRGTECHGRRVLASVPPVPFGAIPWRRSSPSP
jgi:hypothetical protein